MKRRDFMRLSLTAGSVALVPSFNHAATLDLSNINFSSGTYQDNQAQTIIVFLYGGASQLGGNISNIDEIDRHSQNNHKDYFRGVTPTTNGCWQEAGGDEMEKLITDGDMTLYRCCYSQIRENENNKAHGVCVEQNQRGTFDNTGGGVIANIATILHDKGAINSNTLMPFVTMEGESTFYTEGSIPLAGYLKPMGINENFDNPYERTRWTVRRWTYYTRSERDSAPDNYHKPDEEGGFTPAFTQKMDSVAQSHNQAGDIKTAFGRRGGLSDFIKSIETAQVPDLGVDAYPDHTFADKLKAAVKLLDKNPDTKIITLGAGGLGGWDDHNDARDYVTRHEALFRSLRSAMAHLKALNKDGQVNIMVFGEFGRNVNLNSANGWDHGNLQNFFVLGGKNYFTHRGVVGETVVDVTGSLNRLWLKPKSGTYWFEPLSIASTLYKIYGIENPNVLTDGTYPPVNILS
ncbi:MAG: DUF1501 domain-containing protein [Sulfurovum sp.]|nr:DUF1501 domain-containing protein [Sulfurovum sp.]